MNEKVEAGHQGVQFRERIRRLGPTREREVYHRLWRHYATTHFQEEDDDRRSVVRPCIQPETSGDRDGSQSNRRA